VAHGRGNHGELVGGHIQLLQRRQLAEAVRQRVQLVGGQIQPVVCVRVCEEVSSQSLVSSHSAHSTNLRVCVCVFVQEGAGTDLVMERM